MRIPAPDPDPTTGLPRSSHDPSVRATGAHPVPGTRMAASMEGTGTVPRDPSRFSSHIKTGEESAPDPTEAREASTAPVPDTALDTGPVMAAAVGMTDTAPDMGPDTAAAVVGSTEPAAIGPPAIHAVTSEAAGEPGGGPGLGGRYRPGRHLC